MATEREWRSAADRAYANGAFIAGAEGYPPRWEAAAAAFRESAGARARLGLAYVFITHNLAVANESFVTVRDTTTNYYVYPDIKFSTANAVVIEFVSAPSTNQYRVTVAGA